MKNKKFEEYLLDMNWKSNIFKNFKILAIPLKDNIYYYTVSGLLVNTSVLKPDNKKAVGEKPIVLLSSSDYNLIKHYYLKLILNESLKITNEYTSDEDTFRQIENIFKIIEN